MTPLFSVILPTYNRARMARTAIETVLWQTLPERLAAFKQRATGGFIFSNAWLWRYGRIIGPLFDPAREIPEGVLPGHYAVGDGKLPYVTTNVAIERAEVGLNMVKAGRPEEARAFLRSELGDDAHDTAAWHLSYYQRPLLLAGRKLRELVLRLKPSSAEERGIERLISPLLAAEG